ncbi:hypothetical protein [Haploplasma axanthum]|uniref:Uncharacterized protein n=1 Tax=Haploplasma axanthum TaxID=29552 RepID=A0A449BF81_HAPAX|nr:hypothetical protein [Haploplasma axanthum]VEU81096.1 Uncharacterised protein [Haploplasma axanthum]
MPKYYSIKKFEISDDNLKSKYQDYLREVLLGNLPAPALSYEKFIDFEPMFEEVIMKL